uniref:Uncharacterized protein n=1 Tax=Poecilia latipinna TaxID=48699 RepID=A0A3B3TZI1_9TELE
VSRGAPSITGCRYTQIHTHPRPDAALIRGAERTALRVRQDAEYLTSSYMFCFDKLTIKLFLSERKNQISSSPRQMFSQNAALIISETCVKTYLAQKPELKPFLSLILSERVPAHFV